MSLVDSLKKGLFGSEDEYEDQYIDDGLSLIHISEPTRPY